MNVRRIVVHVVLALVICVSVTVIWFECSLGAWEKTAYVMIMVSTVIIPFNVFAQEKSWESYTPIKYFFDACKGVAGLSVAVMVFILANIGRHRKKGLNFLVSLILKIMALGTLGYLFWISYKMRKRTVPRETPTNDAESILMHPIPSTST